MIVDIVFLIVVLVAAVRAAIRGFVAELFTVAAIAVGIVGATLLYPKVTVSSQLTYHTGKVVIRVTGSDGKKILLDIINKIIDFFKSLAHSLETYH